MTETKRLGRGLEALLGPVSREQAEAAGALRELPLSSVKPNPYQPRTRMDQAELTDLASSMQASGLLQPVIVRPRDGGFELIAGFRPLDWLAVEGNYIDMGGDSAEGTSIDSSAISVSALLLAEVGIVDLYARAGMAMWDTEFSSLGDSVSDDGWEPTYGVGVGVHFGSLGVRAEYEYLKAEPFDDFVDGVETKYSTITLSVTYTFL